MSVLQNTRVFAGIGLAIVRGPSTVAVSWPFPSTGFVLESATNLISTNWQSAAEMPVANNNRLEATVPLNYAESYFRLHKP